MTEGSIGRRYAKALIELAREENAVDRVGEDLARFVAAGRGDQGKLEAVMTNPAFTAAERRAVLDGVLPALKLHDHSARFFKLLLDKDRMHALGDIVREYGVLADAEANRVRATVTTAQPMTASLKKNVTDAISRATGKNVVVETRVDPSLIGGMVALVGGKVYDASLRTRLEDLQLSLATSALATSAEG